MLNCFISYITYSAMNMFAGKQLNDLQQQDVYTCNSHSQQSVAVLMLLAGVAALKKIKNKQSLATAAARIIHCRVFIIISVLSACEF